MSALKEFARLSGTVLVDGVRRVSKGAPIDVTDPCAVTANGAARVTTCAACRSLGSHTGVGDLAQAGVATARRRHRARS